MMPHPRRLFALSVSRVAALVGLAVLAGGAGACAAPEPPSHGEGVSARHSEAVVVDYYDGSTKLRSCAGTLLSTNVVVAPAHCADGSSKAVVTASNAAHTRTTVAKVYTYDWAPADTNAVRADRHDVALLVLRKPVLHAHVAKVQKDDCDGCKIVQLGRSHDQKGSVLSISKRLRLNTGGALSKARIGVGASRITPRGGAMYRVTNFNDRIIVGLVVGHGERSGAGVVVPLSDSTMQRWIHAVVKTESTTALATSGTSSGTSSLRILSEEDGTDDSAAAPAKDTTPERVDDESASGSEPSVEQASPPESTPDSTPAADPVVDSPTSDSSPKSDPASSSDPSSAPDGTGSPTTPDEPVVPTGETTSESNSSGAGAPTATPAANGDPGATDDAKAIDPRATPAATDPVASTAPTSSTPNETSPGWPGTIAGVGALKAPASTEETTVHPSGNAVTVASPGDPAFKDDAKLAAQYTGTANVYNSHGMPGTLLGGVPAETMKGFLADDKPLIVASCFSAAPMSGGSTIRRVVSAYGDDPAVASRVYGCSGYASGDDANGLGCTGTWLDANGKAVPSTERDRLSLHQYQCSSNTFDKDGKPVWSDCASNN